MNNILKSTSNITGTVFDIQRTALTDGPGIRTTVFVKGCPLRCLWCHNPESQKNRSEIMVFAEKCTACGACESICPNKCHSISVQKENSDAPIHLYDPSSCSACGKCCDSCPSDAIVVKGQEMSVDEVFSTVVKDKSFYDASGGGITISGGEPLADYNVDFVSSLLKRCKSEGIGTCIETCGYVSANTIKELLPFIDIFLYDYKATGSDQHKKLTGVDNRLILDNLDMIYACGKDIILRCPLVPRYNVAVDFESGDKHLDGIIELNRKYPNLRGIELMAYHNMGVAKHERLGTQSQCSLPNTEESTKDGWLKYLHKNGCSKAIIS